jgi:hypothetical protein
MLRTATAGRHACTANLQRVRLVELGVSVACSGAGAARIENATNSVNDI